MKALRSALLALGLLVAGCSDPEKRAISAQGIEVTGAFRHTIVEPTDRMNECNRRIDAILTAVTGQVFPRANLRVEQHMSTKNPYIKAKGGDYSATCLPASGNTTFWHNDRLSKRDSDHPHPPPRSNLEGVVARVIQALASDDVIDRSQFDIGSAIWKNTKESGGGGLGEPELGPFIVDTRVRIDRRIDGIRVINSSILMTIDNALNVTSVYLQVRRTGAVNETAIVSARTDADAMREFRSIVGPEAVSPTLETAYVDAGPFEQQRAYEPHHVVHFGTRVGPNNDLGKRRVWHAPVFEPELDDVDLSGLRKRANKNHGNPRPAAPSIVLP